MTKTEVGWTLAGLCFVSALCGATGWAVDRENRIMDEQIAKRMSVDRKQCDLTYSSKVWRSSPMCEQVRFYDKWRLFVKREGG